MRLRRLLPLFAIPLILAACENPAARTVPPEIEGLWLRAHEQPSTVNFQDVLVFGPGDRFEHRLIVYQNAGHGAMTARYNEVGEFRLRGERLELRIASVTEWDAQTGQGVMNPSLGWQDAGTVRITGSEMVRTYLTYPADAPVPTTVRYFRPGLD